MDNVKAHRTPDRGLALISGLRVEWSWKTRLGAGQGFCAATCSPRFIFGLGWLCANPPARLEETPDPLAHRHQELAQLPAQPT